MLTVNQSIAILEEHEKLCITQKATLVDKKNQLLVEKNQQALITLQIKQKEEEIAQLKIKLQEEYTQWRYLHKKYLHYSPSSDHEKEKQDLINKITQHQNEQQKFLLLKEKQLNLKQQEQELIAKIKIEHTKKVQESYNALTQIQHELSHRKNQLESLEKQKSKIATESQIREATRKMLETFLESLKFIKAQLQAEELLFDKRRMLYSQWGAEINSVTIEMKQLQQKQNLTSDETNPSCPLCEQTLSSSRKKYLKNHFLQKEDFLNHRLVRLKTLIGSLKQLLVEQNENLEKIKKKVEEYKTAEIKYSELMNQAEKTEAELEEYNKNHACIQKEIQTLEIKLQEQQTAHEQVNANEKKLLIHNKEYIFLASELKKISDELSIASYNEEYFIALRNQLTTLEEVVLQAKCIEQELAKKKILANTIAEQCRIIKNTKLMRNELNAKNAQYESLEDQIQQLYTLESTIDQTAQKYQKEKELLLQQRGGLEKERMTLVQYETEFKFQEKKIQELQEVAFDYQTIANALGKDGIQALIIEESLPEIEQEANDLLGQLTDNQAHIIIESLRDLKKGGTKETLDIKISDSIGIRPYELFSGGEAFRIDFALRLAISKLLARRAGTSLQTLIIDEGFGSQDEDGLIHIMDALYKIQNSFCKIIIVSHLPSMKDQFPVHFFVEKGTQGSSLRVIEQG